MNKEHARLILESFREEDRDDPVFREALDLAAQDAGLGTWLDERLREQAALARALRAVPVPPSLREQVLQSVQLAAKVRSRQRKIWGALALAACLAIAASWFSFWPASPGEDVDSIADRAIAESRQLPALDFVCFSAAEVASWINRQPAMEKANYRLPPPGNKMNMRMIGAKHLEWGGRPVVLIALQNGKKMAMLYLGAAADFPNTPQPETVLRDGWSARVGRAGGIGYVLVTPGPPEQLDFSLPFETP